ncbi:YfgM family protein [Tahibacter amnicola]|uniref:Ancillary SecYEG translocon subunit n=1 Tax=Tahibacter amnicola TaxID=2976241 RepID=A0ABY6BBV9_9GAMM|nr:tetratricopeptide repeat protein [Tahibacter amnicola]UXI66605.1 tetratricopeptide repeat protein [Tahibacter amnicola]
MAFDQLDEHEQGEIVRKWMRENYASIAVGIVLGLLLVFGLHQYWGHQALSKARAAEEFRLFTTALEAKNDEMAKAAAGRIERDFGKSAYAVLTLLREANNAVTKKDLATAETQLQSALDKASSDAMKTLVGQRLARVKVAMDKGQDALALLDKLPAGAYAAAIAELRGDILVALGKRDEARTAYQASIDALDATAPNRATLEMKRDDLLQPGASASATETKSS